MPQLDVNGASLFYEDTGGSGPPIVFSHGLLWNTSLFAPQIAALRERYRCIAYDHRGQGRSTDPAGTASDMEAVAADAPALIETLGLGRVHFCGLSMGGFVAMRLAARRPDLVRSLILCETSAEPEPAENRPKYRMLNLVARTLGPWAVTGAVMPILFGQSSLTDPAKAADRARWRAALRANRRAVWRAVDGVITRASVVDALGRITAPTLVIVGEEDVATVPAKAEAIASGIAGARLVRIPKAGHSSTVEQPEAVTAAIAAFVAAH